MVNPDCSGLLGIGCGNALSFAAELQLAASAVLCAYFKSVGSKVNS